MKSIFKIKNISQFINESDDDGIIFSRSQIDKSFQLIILYPEYEKYSHFKKFFDAHGLGFIDVRKKIIYIDGSQMEDLTFDHLLAIQAHEIGHYKLKHRGNYSRSQELEADIYGIDILNKLGHTKAEEFLSDRMYGMYSKKEINTKRDKILK
jgi:Zn-dependent protease with chaperone function